MRNILQSIGEWLILALTIGTVLMGIYLAGMAYTSPHTRVPVGDEKEPGFIIVRYRDTPTFVAAVATR